MATYYKYAERSAESQINWAEIGKNMTDMLQQEVAVREQKKAAIDEATRKYAEQLSNAPQGEHVGAKQEALRFADEATNYMLMQERLLKSGLMKPRDYLIARQNLVDGTTRAFSAMKAFQEQYAERMERARTDTSSALELDNLEEVQGYGNFSQSGFFIDAPTGKVNVGLKELQTIDGKQVVGLKEGSTRGMEYIDGSIYGKIDKFKPREALVGIAETLGTDIISNVDPSTLTKLGNIRSIEDLRNRKDIDPVTGKIYFDFYSSMRSAVNAVMANPLQKASLLRDTLGYQTTLDANEAAKNPKLILKVIDPATGRGEYKFSAEQETAAEDYMMGQLLGMVNRKIEDRAIPQVSQLRPKDESERKDVENKNVLSNVAKLYYGTDAEVQEASDFLRSFNPAIDTIDRSGNNITITYKDGRPPEVRPWKSESGQLLNQEGWVTANTNFFLPEGSRIGNVKELIKRGGIDTSREFNAESKGFSAGTIQEREDIPVAFKRVAQERSGLKTNTFVKDNEDKTVSNLRTVVGSIPGLEGLTVEVPFSPGSDVAVLKDEDGNIVLEFALDELDDDIAQGYVNQLLQMAANRTDIEKQAIYVGKERGVSEPQQRTSGRQSNLPPR